MDDLTLRRELDSVIASALEHEEVVEQLRELKIPGIEVARAIRNKPGVMARYRSARDWAHQAAVAIGSDSERLWTAPLRRRRWITVLPPAAQPLLAVIIAFGYGSLSLTAVPRMPLGLVLFAIAGGAAVLALSVRLASGAVYGIYKGVRLTRDSRLWESEVLRTIVLPEIRQYLAEQGEPLYGTELSVARARHDDDDREAPTVVTTAGNQLRRILGRSTAEAVGIAGPRGVGKTTTIRAIADGMFSAPLAAPPLPVIAAAPSKYEGRDFVLHLHALLCNEVVAHTSPLLLLPGQEVRRRPPTWRVLKWPAAVVLLFASLLGAAALLGTGFTAAMGEPLDQRGVFSLGTVTSGRAQIALVLVDVAGLVAVAVVLAVLCLVPVGLAMVLDGGAIRLQRLRRASTYPWAVRLRAEAFEQLRSIRFLQTYTSGWSGKIGLPLKAEAGWNAAIARAEQNRTHPEVVADFRRFAERTATTLSNAGVIDQVIIAIDELDKVDDPAEAHALVNDVKGIFGIPNCLFLVSVSEDALSAFERRGIPVRDAFDSAFTQIVRVDNFTLAESRRWLSRRLRDVPEQFTYLLHCLSGGLPRELRRATTELVDIVAEDDRGDLEYVTEALLDRELDRKTHAFMAAVHRCDDSAERSDYVADLVTVPDARTPGQQVALAEKLRPKETVTELRSVRWQSACFLLFCATVREIFGNALGPSGLGAELESLARARAQLSVDPQVAWRLVWSVREARVMMAAPSEGPRDD
ncbi:P-loop NTPase fold protein [Actinophytocola sp.]|uniref:P-loop NTPase fold protein n=1 Tax=Actinophytocola sp. TaxID=1872138 RepID=UPI003D6BEE0B